MRSFDFKVYETVTNNTPLLQRKSRLKQDRGDSVHFILKKKDKNGGYQGKIPKVRDDSQFINSIQKVIERL